MVVWRTPVNLAAAAQVLPALEQHLAYLQTQLIALTAEPVDQLYSRIGLVNGTFFPQGWGDLRIVNLQEDIKLMTTWPPPGLKMEWKRIDAGTRDGIPFKLYEGRYMTPCINRVYDALPTESRMGRVQLLVPDLTTPASPRRAPPPAASLPTTLAHRLTGGRYGDTSAPRAGFGARDDESSGSGASPWSPRDVQAKLQGRALSAAIHLAATGDQGFGRRLRLAFPLLQHGVCGVVHESPFYGARRPAAQKGSKLLRVSDLMALGWATIYESVNLLHWLTQEGFNEGGLCMAGLSMGGVHACMTSALYPQGLATAALLAPRSAAVAYCDGALSAAMAWQPLLAEADAASNDVLQVINSAAQPVSVMREATYALSQLELAWEAAGRSGLRTPPLQAPQASPLPGTQDTEQHATPQQHTRQHYHPHADAAPHAQHGGHGGAHGHVHAAGSPGPGMLPRVPAGPSRPDGWKAIVDDPRTPSAQASQLSDAAGQASEVATRLHDSLQWLRHEPGVQAAEHGAHAGQAVVRGPTSGPAGAGGVLGGAASAGASQRVNGSPPFSPLQQLEAAIAGRQELKPVLTSLLRGLSELKSLSSSDTGLQRQLTLRRLKHVLETYTDITRFPVPPRPDAAVFVAATHDAYVSTESVQQLSQYWRGSEMRLVSGGHVTAFLMHQDKFRTAILDSIDRLNHPPAASPGTPSNAPHGPQDGSSEAARTGQ